MGLYVCPADTVVAPPETVWRLLTDPATYETWTDARVDSVEPPGPAQPGQVVLLSGGVLGIRLGFRFDLERVDPATHDFELRVQFPFGIRMREHITVRPVEGGSLVQFR
ncbi:MAG TPA: SRPBCC family protein [Candidatus Dormibacteraeota bacterium]